MKYLLIGGSGFIGKHLALSLAKNNNEVTITGRGSDPGLKGISYKTLDFVDCSDFTDCIRDADVIIHMVSTIMPSENLSDINQELSENIFPTTILLKNVADLNKEILFVSSGGAVYGDNTKPNSEKDVTNPICNYGMTKLIIEKYLGMYNHLTGLKYKIVRLSNPYSEEVYHNRKQGIIPIIVDNITNANTIHVWGNNQIRDYIHIDDLVSGIIAVLNYTGQEKIFNIGSGVGYTLKDVIELVERKLNKKATIVYEQARKCDVEKNILNIELIKHETGWEPKISLSDGINKIIENKVAKETNDKS